MHTKRRESSYLASLLRRLSGPRPDLVPYVERAKSAVDEFRGWLEQRQKTMRGSSAVGIENYNWYLKNVHLVSYTWQEQLEIEQLELQRSMATLRLEEQRNRKLPPLQAPANGEELRRRNEEAVDTFMNFMKEQEIFTVRDYMHLEKPSGGGSILPERARDFFHQILYRDYLPLKCHEIHWLEKQRMAQEPHASPIRSAPLLYDIWDSRSEGLATAWEEMMMHAGLFDQRPRTRELIYILVATRCIRGIADLKIHSGEFTLDDAIKYIVETTPNGWLPAEGATIWEDLGIYLRQPSYGTTYIVGKIAFDRLLGDKSRLVGANFRFKDFMDQFFDVGVIPMSLVRWEMTGLDDEVKALNLRQ